MRKSADQSHFLCKSCRTEFEFRVKRPAIVKLLFFWLPLQRYHCSNCAKNYYILVSKKNSKYVMLHW
jgi:transposase-like protein